MMTRTAPFLAAACLVACQSSAPEVRCPTSAGAPVPLCELAKADLVAQATVLAFSPDASRVLDLTGFRDTVFTPARLEIQSTAKGFASGRLDVLWPGCIEDDGASVHGALKAGGQMASGHFFIVERDGYAVVLPQGFVRREDSVVKNPGFAANGLTAEEFDAQLQQALKNPSCATPDAGAPDAG